MSRFLTPDDVETFRSPQHHVETIRADSLTSTDDRTLIYGYTTERDTFHLWFENRQFHRAIYRPARLTGEHPQLVDLNTYTSIPIDAAVPNKRIYPERCDYEFVRLLHLRGVRLPFTAYSNITAPGPFFGTTIFGS